MILRRHALQETCSQGTQESNFGTESLQEVCECCLTGIIGTGNVPLSNFQERQACLNDLASQAIRQAVECIRQCESESPWPYTDLVEVRPKVFLMKSALRLRLVVARTISTLYIGRSGTRMVDCNLLVPRLSTVPSTNCC
jgi:hypothetical protein